MSKAFGMVDKTYGRWTVLSLGQRKRSGWFVICECECGTVKELQASSVRRGNSTSCGCSMREPPDFKSILLSSYIPEPNTGCWLWMRSLTVAGYAQIEWSGKLYYGHRLSFSIFNGEIPDGWFVCHRCDQRCCINPKHLFVGRAVDNVRDMHAKGRAYKAVGSDVPSAKLDEKKVEEIRALYDSCDASFGSLGTKYGVDAKTIEHAIKRKTWRHVK